MVTETQVQIKYRLVVIDRCVQAAFRSQLPTSRLGIAATQLAGDSLSILP